jgi:uncharacterized RDD family membrane protein YckC
MPGASHRTLPLLKHALALIGDEWLTITDEHGRRRLDSPDDFVRVEIEAALTRKVRVIPILVDGARMPRADELPDSLAKLVRRHALELSPARFDFDTSRLLKVLSTTLAEAKARPSAPEAPSAGEATPTTEAAKGDDEALVPDAVELAARESDDRGPHGADRAGRATANGTRAAATERPSSWPSRSPADSGRLQRDSPERDRYQGEELATWWQRAAAHLLDLLIVAVPFVILVNVSEYFALLVVLVIWLYNRSYLQGTNGKSWGKRALRLRLVRITDKQPIGSAAALVRNLAHALDLVTLCVGYLLPLWDAHRQTLADKIMKTIVIAEHKPQTARTTT